MRAVAGLPPGVGVGPGASSSATRWRTGACGWPSSPGCSSRCSTCCRSGSASVALVGKIPGPGGEPIPYDQFVAPGLMAAAAMNGAVLDTTFNFFFKFKYAHTYDAMLATPLEVGDVAHGEVIWALIRGGIYSARVPRHDGRARVGRFVVGGAGDPGRAADRVRVRGRRDRRDHVHAVVDRLRLREPRADPDVPVRGDVLPDLAVPGRTPDRRAVHTALPGRRASSGHSRPGNCSGRCS